MILDIFVRFRYTLTCTCTRDAAAMMVAESERIVFPRGALLSRGISQTRPLCRHAVHGSRRLVYVSVRQGLEYVDVVFEYDEPLVAW